MRRWVTVLSVVMLALALVPEAHATSVRWTRDAGTAVFGAAVAPDGGVYVAGKRRVGITVEATLIKYGKNGGRQWTKTWLPDQQASTSGVGVAVAPDGIVYLLGSVQGQCEGAGYFVRAYAPGGQLVAKYVTKKWAGCSIAETAFGIAVSGSRVVVVGMHHGCCGDPTEDGWVRGFSRSLSPNWTARFEPPAPISKSFFDRATGVAIGSSGSIYVSGWAATQAVPPSDEGIRTPGTVILEKLTPGGHVVWSHRPGVPVPGELGIISVAARGNRVMVTAPAGGMIASIFWGKKTPLSHVWLGRFNPAGSVLRTWSWATKRKNAAEPLGVSIDAKNRTWVAGTQRDPSDGGLDAFVTTFAAGGRRIGNLRTGDTKFVQGTGVAARFGAYATGFTSNQHGQWKIGHLGKLGV